MATYKIQVGKPPTQNAVSFLDAQSPVNTDFVGSATLTEATGNGFYAGTVGAPTSYWRGFTAAAGSTGDVLRCVGHSVNNFDVHTNAFIVGKTARIRRIENGVFVDVRTSEVIEAHTYGLNPIIKYGVYTGTEAEFLVPAFHTRDSPITYSVAAVDPATALWGAMSSYVELPLVSNSVTGTADTAVTSLAPVTTNGGVAGPGAALAAPTNIAVAEKAANSQVHKVTWDAVPGATHYIVFYTPNPMAEATHDPRIVLAPDPANPVGPHDFVFLSGEILEQSEADSGRFWAVNAAADDYMPRTASNRLGSDPLKGKPSWVAFDGDKPDALLPDHFLRMTATAGQQVELQHYYSGGTLQTFYTHLVPGDVWKVEMWIKASEALTMPFQNFHPHVTDNSMNVTTSWQKVAFTFTASGVADTPTAYAWAMRYLATGNLTVDVAGLKVWNSSFGTGEYGEPLASTPATTHLRSHTLIKLGSVDMTMKGYLGYTGSTYRSETLQTLLKTCKDRNLIPHLQIEPIYTRADFSDLMAYLAAPVSSGHPMALLRQSHGQTTPWTSVFKQILLELGNEIWNSTNGFFLMPAMTDASTLAEYSGMTAAGYLMESIAQDLKADTHWNSKLKFFAGGWARQPQFTEELLRAFPACDYIGIAAYTSGWDVNSNILEDNIAVAQNLLSVVANHGHTMDQHADVVARVNADRALAGIPPVRATCYEAGPGYQIDGLNDAIVTPESSLEEARIQATLFAACANMDSFLYMAARDFAAANFFTIGPGAGYIGKSQDGDGGREFTPYAFWADFAARMGEMKVYSADMMRVDTFTGVGTSGVGEFELDSAGMYFVESITYPGKFALVGINRKVDKTVWPDSDPDYDAQDRGTQDWLFATGFKSFTSCTQMSLEQNCNNHNRHLDGTRIEIINGANTRVADPTCVDTSATFSDITNSITDASRVEMAGVNGGNARVLFFEGVSFE